MINGIKGLFIITIVTVIAFFMHGCNSVEPAPYQNPVDPESSFEQEMLPYTQGTHENQNKNVNPSKKYS